MKPRYRITIVPDRYIGLGAISEFTLNIWGMRAADSRMMYDKSTSKQISCVGYKRFKIFNITIL